MSEWPFHARIPLTETLQWQTDVIQAKSSEQRIALRAIPRRILQLTHRFDQPTFKVARSLMRFGLSFLTPDWPLFVRLPTVPAGESVVVPVDTTSTFLSTGQAHLRSGDRWQTVSITSMAADSITLGSVSDEMPTPIIAPLVQTHAPGGLDGSRSAGGFVTASVEMHIHSGADIAASSFPQYAGIDVMTDCPAVGGGAFDEPLSWDLTVIDNVMNAPDYLVNRDWPNALYQIRWVMRDVQQRHQLRRWFYSLRGRQKAFWLPHFGKDFVLAQSVAANTTTITVKRPVDGPAPVLTTPFHIRIASPDAVFFRQVDQVTVGADTINLVMSANLGVVVSEQEGSISVMQRVRLNTDRVEMEYGGADVVTAAVTCIEVPD